MNEKELSRILDLHLRLFQHKQFNFNIDEIGIKGRKITGLIDTEEKR